MNEKTERLEANMKKQPLEEVCEMVFQAIKTGAKSHDYEKAFGNADPRSLILTVLAECMQQVCKLDSIDRFCISNSYGLIAFLSNEHEAEIQRIANYDPNDKGPEKQPVH